MFKGGYTGKVLRINLTEKRYTEEPLREDVAAKYIGGAGVGIKYMLDEVPTKCDPLGPENNLYFSLGPLCGTDAPAASRVMIVTKSPLTGAVAKSSGGGHFPAEIKFAGYDMLIVEGQAETPTWLWIKDGKVHFREANHLWGLNTFDTQQLIKDNLGDQNVRVACIGQAGENLSAFASIINERHASGRKGVGAVMGSKNLKAIAIRGENEVPVANKKAFKAALKSMFEAMKASEILYPHFSKGGTPMIIDNMFELGLFPTKNFENTGEWDPLDYLGSEVGGEKFNIAREFCYKCPVGCSQVKLAREGPFKGMASIPEFETMYSFGGMTMMHSFNEVIAADRLCDEYGMDTISCGVTIAFAMECYEKGILSIDDLDGIDLKWSNAEAMIQMVHKIAHRDGIGDILADGVKKAAERIGKGSEKYAMHVKGLELAGYDPRGAKAHGLNYATGYTGADHCLGYAFQEMFSIPVPYPVNRLDYKGKGRLTKWNQDTRSAVCDCAPMCGFILDMALADVCHKNTADLVNAIAGASYTPDDIMLCGERVNNVARIFNIRAGFTRDDDTFPERIMTEALKDGGAKGSIIPPEERDYMLDEYFEDRGWTLAGVPTAERLASLGMEEDIAKLRDFA
ncbi:MAG: aldehyde ferredoxin oxidoreductase family protein [Oscillospiraceae bacterium]|nr:aldehyde ferredoxin oxidoreductase family protein [Oscillospiraceae bacterium]